MATAQVIQIAPPKLIQKGAASSRILGLMALTAVFGVIGAEIRGQTKKTTGADKLGYILGSPFLVIFGAAAATVILVSIADFGGDVGETLGVGLAGVALLGTMLIEGGPVFTAINKLFTKSSTTTTTSTKKGTSK